MASASSGYFGNPCERRAVLVIFASVLIALLCSQIADGSPLEGKEPVKETDGSTKLENCLNDFLSFMGCIPSFQNAMNFGQVGRTWAISPTECCNAVVNMDPTCFSSILKIMQPRASRKDYMAALAAKDTCSIHR
ncbi:hypothetical protein KP509_24G045900 [Ceratopteris richardii]|uniref:Prolamin-like domain-containing protein n=1 Tax=Ceratopteris richardii TaxID=49495 RepID=A0A8T2RXI2_CERRI|nr:hypothetical protein KP509_24G045900 [Ceratopteris richardii]